MTTLTAISTRARTILGRPARTRRQGLDWEAVAATRRAAEEVLGPALLLSWAPHSPCSLRDFARAYVDRRVQAYGPISGLPVLDLSAYEGGAYHGRRRPRLQAVRAYAEASE